MSRDGRAYDELFERLVDAAENEREPDWDLIGSECDRAEVERLWAMAQDVSSVRVERLPRVPGYVVLAELGRGGMGSIYLAREERLGGRTVALKVLPRWAALSRSMRDRFESEAAGVARLRHRHVITVHRVIDKGGLSGFTMEWVDGGSLARLIAQGGPALRDRSGRFSATFLDGLGEEWGAGGYDRYVCRVGRAIAEALSVVHEAGMLHRDVKPSNILLRADGEPVLSDFGLVRELGSAVHTQTGQFVGTAAYAPPEQLRGQLDRVDQRSDVYALGVTLYHAVTGRLPWPDVATWRLADVIESGEPPAAHRVARDTPRELSIVIGRAMQPDPGARYQTAGELAEDLDRVLADRPIRARPTTLARRGRKFARRHRRPILGAVGGGLSAMVVGVALAAWFVLIPRWSDHELRLARQSVLNRGPNLKLVTRVYWNERAPSAPRADSPPMGSAAERAALDHYARSARLAQGRRQRIDEHRAIRTAHRLNHGTASGASESARWPDMPGVAFYLRRMGDTRLSTTYYTDPDPPDPETGQAARALGLIAFHIGDFSTALRAWSRFEREVDSDPVIEASMGEMYLVIGEPALAYPRLRAAFDAFPDTRSLNMSLAECAIRVGDLQRAERLLERAIKLPDPDNYGRILRLQGLMLESQGRLDEAEAFYAQLRDSDRLYPGNPLLIDQHAALLWRLGRREEALQAWANGFTGFGVVDLLMRRFVTHLNIWWIDLDESDRRRLLTRATRDRRRASDPVSWARDKAPLSFPDLLLAERLFRRELTERPEPLAEVWRGGPRVDWDAPTPCTAIGDLIRVEDVEFWDRLAAAPDAIALDIGRAWASAEPEAVASAERRLPGWTPPP